MPPKNQFNQLRGAVIAYNNAESKVDLIIKAKRYDKYAAISVQLEEKYDALSIAWESYKENILEKDDKTEEDFNATISSESDKYAYRYNDHWKADKHKSFVNLFNTLMDDKPSETEAVEPKVNLVEVSQINFVCQEMENLITLAKSNVANLHSEIEAIANDTLEESVVTRYANLIKAQRERITKDLSEKLNVRLTYSDVGVENTCTKEHMINQISSFTSDQLQKLDVIEVMLTLKVKPKSSSKESFGHSRSSTEKVLLEKSKPPKFNGDIIEYPEFKRKWKALVESAKLPTEAELDKLKDAVPKTAKDQLYGCNEIKEAWSILDKRFGNNELLAKKLKDKLKNISVDGANEPEKVINLQIKVRTIVKQLTTLNLQDCLRYDPEFLSTVYNCLPPRCQDNWLEYEKSENKWNDMLLFLDKCYEKATEQLVLLTTCEKSASDKEKKKSKDPTSVHAKKGQKSGDPDDTTDQIEVNKTKNRKKKLKESIGPCPLCKEEHTYFKKQDKSNWPSDRLFTCKKFKEKTDIERGQYLEELQGCSRCTSWKHAKDKCTSKVVKCTVDNSDGTKCEQDHSYLVHGSGVAYCNVAKLSFTGSSQIKTDIDIDQATVYYLQDVPIAHTNVQARVFYDEGSNRVLIRDEFADKAGLVKKKIQWKLAVVGSEEDPEIIDGHMYETHLIDKFGKYWKIWGYGINSIMKTGVPNMMNLKKYFPHVPDEALKGLMKKEVDVLLGLNENHLMPVGGKGKDQHQGLRSKTSLFGCGFVMGGWHSELNITMEEFSSQAATMRVAKIQVIPESFKLDFWDSENMGVLPPPSCEKCKSCRKSGVCSDRNRVLTEKQREELEVISQKTKLINNEIWVEYPYKKDPACLPENRNAAIKVAEKVEKDVIKDSLHEVYNEQVKSMLERGTAVELTEQELRDWAGPVHYITHHPVLKDSVTTPCRLVTNSSFGNPSLNSIVMKGPNSMNSMLDIMLRWRSYEYAIQYDLAKAYNTMHTGPLERHLRRFIWRFSPQESWKEFAFDRVHFGDISAGCHLETGLDKTADAGEYISPVASQKIKDDRYVDDGLTGGDKDTIEKLVGNKKEDGIYDGELSEILSLGGFKIKAITVSGQEPNEDSALMGGHVLGYDYDVQKDVLSLTFPINMSKKKRSVRTEPNLTINDITSLDEKLFTKRILLGITNSFKDFLGIGAPFIIRFKILMQKVHRLPCHWDTHVPESLKQEWKQLVAEALESGPIIFPRSTRPKDACPDTPPTVVGFSDFAEDAFEARVYNRWKLKP